LGDSFGQARVLDALWSINQNVAEKAGGIGRIFIVKHRDGESRRQMFFKQNKDTLDMIEISQETYGALRSQFSQKKADDVKVDTIIGKNTWKQNG
jgi:hypothetical protein